VEAACGREAHLTFGPVAPADVPATWADVTKARELLGWRPEVGLEEGVGRLVGWYERNRSWAKDIRVD
jgi:UDP-glucuronate 4-epimerase